MVFPLTAGALALQRDQTTVEPSSSVLGLLSGIIGSLLGGATVDKEGKLTLPDGTVYTNPGGLGKQIGSLGDVPLMLQNTTPVSSPDGQPVTKPAPIGLGGYTTRSGITYSEDELKKMFMPTYEWPPKPPEPVTSAETTNTESAKSKKSGNKGGNLKKRFNTKRGKKDTSGNQPNARGDSYASRNNSSRSGGVRLSRNSRRVTKPRGNSRRNSNR